MNLSVFLHLSLLIIVVSCFGFLRSSRVFGSDLFVAKVIEDPAKWSCDAIAKRFPSGRMKMEYTATEGENLPQNGKLRHCVLCTWDSFWLGGRQDNPISLKDVESWWDPWPKVGQSFASSPWIFFLNLWFCLRSKATESSGAPDKEDPLNAPS